MILGRAVICHSHSLILMRPPQEPHSVLLWDQMPAVAHNSTSKLKIKLLNGRLLELNQEIIKVRYVIQQKLFSILHTLLLPWSNQLILCWQSWIRLNLKKWYSILLTLKINDWLIPIIAINDLDCSFWCIYRNLPNITIWISTVQYKKLSKDHIGH